MVGSLFIFSFKYMIKKLIFNLILVVVFAFVMDFAIGRILRYFYFQEVVGLHHRTTYSLETTKAELLVLGSSRANHHYVPEIFEKRLKISFYNTGRDGNRLLYNYAIFKSILKRYTPKIIILDIGFDELYYDPKELDRLSSLLPYYKNHPELRSLIEKRSPFEKIKFLSNIYPFNSSILTIAIGNMEINKTRKGDIKGYVPLKGIIKDNNINKLIIKDSQINMFKFKVLKKIAQICLLKQIKLFIIQSPVYAMVHKTVSTEKCIQIANEYKAIFINTSNNPFFLNKPALFQDKSHLNCRGAIEFSKIIVDKIFFQLTKK